MPSEPSLTHALRRPGELCAWCGPSLLIVNARGEVGDDSPLGGYYYREARYLRRLRLTLNGASAWLSSAGVIGSDTLIFDFVYPELDTFGGGGSGPSEEAESFDAAGIAHRGLELRALYHVGCADFRITLTITNRAREETALDVAWEVDSDFADLSEALSGKREKRPDLPYRTRISLNGAESLTTHVQLRRHESAQLTLLVQPQDYHEPLSAGDIAAREGSLRDWQQGLCRIESPGNSVVAAILEQQIADYAAAPLLEGKPDEWLTPQAGLPLYPALFGRDALTGGWQAAMLDRGTSLDHTLTRLTRLQGRQDNAWRDEQPGRIVQQVRTGPLARLDLTPFGRYYGDFASPFMFIIGLAHLYSWNGERTMLARHWDTARRILDWARTHGDRDGDGYQEYLTRSPMGAEHQGWKDSGDAVVYEDGTPAHPPLGTCELQAYWFAAQQLMAVLSWIMGAKDDAKEYWRSAAELKERFNRDWWLADRQEIALALDADKQPIAAASSNMGHCLATGIIRDEYLPALAGRLFAPDLFSGWGIRTLSSTHRAYNPVSYHLGSVWPVENGTIVFGLRRFGLNTLALELAHALFDLVALHADHRVPECVGGYARGDWPTPGAYPRANPVQLWNTSAYVMVLQSILGLQPVAPLDLLVVDPLLPSWLPEVIVHDLRLAGATATLRFWRDQKGASHAEVLHKRGTLHLLKQPPPESLTARPRDRFRAFADRVLHF